MPNSVLEAIRLGIWDFEPEEKPEDDYCPADAMPGTKSKLDILAERVHDGLPLWHSEDRSEHDDKTEAKK